MATLTKQTFTISGMTCTGCKAAVEYALNQVSDIQEIEVNLEKGTVTLFSEKSLNVTDLNGVLPDKYVANQVPHEYIEMEQPSDTNDQSKWSQLKPLFLILFYIASASVLIHLDAFEMQEVMLDFMGLFYIVFSFFKMLDLKGFPESFRMYDPLAKQVPFYGKVYPFLETTLGLMFLFRFEIVIALAATIVILGITTVGVVQTLLSKKTIRCACLGTVLNLPMTEATFIENALMILMAIGSLIFIN